MLSNFCQSTFYFRLPSELLDARILYSLLLNIELFINFNSICSLHYKLAYVPV